MLGKSVVFAQSAPKQNESAAVLFQAYQWPILAYEWHLMTILTLWGLFLPKTIMVSNQGNRHFRRIKTKDVGRGCTHQRQENSNQTNPDDPWRTEIIIPDDSGRCSDQRSFILPNADPWSQSCEVENGPLRAETLLAAYLVTDDFLSESKQNSTCPIITEHRKCHFVWFGRRISAHAPVLFGIHRHGKRRKMLASSCWLSLLSSRSACSEILRRLETKSAKRH